MDEHNRARYRRGCRCDVRRAANRIYQREHRAKRLRLAPPLADSPAPLMGRVEAAVQRDLDALPLAAERPGLAQATLAMARLLDNRPAARGRRAPGRHPERAAQAVVESAARLSLGGAGHDAARRPRRLGGISVSLAADDAHAGLYCAAAVIRSRQRNGEPIPEWLRRHSDRLDAEIRMSESGHESDSDTGQFDQDELITAREVSQMLGCSKRQAQRLASDLEAEIVGGRWLFRRSAVTEYVEGRRRRAV